MFVLNFAALLLLAAVPCGEILILSLEWHAFLTSRSIANVCMHCIVYML